MLGVAEEHWGALERGRWEPLRTSRRSRDWGRETAMLSEDCGDARSQHAYPTHSSGHDSPAHAARAELSARARAAGGGVRQRAATRSRRRCAPAYRHLRNLRRAVAGVARAVRA